MSTAPELPALPSVGPVCYAMRADIELYRVPRVGAHLVGVYDIALYTADQMLAYGAACAAAEREACAKLCEEGEEYSGTDSWLVGHATACKSKAAAIRAKK